MNSVYLQAVLKGWRNSVLFTPCWLALDGADVGLLLRKIVVASTGVLLLRRLAAWMFLTLSTGGPPSVSNVITASKDDELRFVK